MLGRMTLRGWLRLSPFSLPSSRAHPTIKMFSDVRYDSSRAKLSSCVYRNDSFARKRRDSFKVVLRVTGAAEHRCALDWIPVDLRRSFDEVSGRRLQMERGEAAL